MPDPTGQPLSGVYNGFSVTPPAQRSKALPVPKAVTVGVGVGAALALGLLVGLFAKPDLGTSAPGAPMRPVAPAATMPVVVNAATQETPLAAKAAGKLEVLSPDMVRAANIATVRAPLPVSAAPQPAAAGDPACTGARSRAAQLLCADPELAAADREMTSAYRRALRAGAPPDQLQADQREWSAAREDMARRSPRAVADLYQQRIDELNQLAEEGPG